MLAPQAVIKARQADLVEYLSAKGYKLKKEGQNYRVIGHQGLIVQGNHWQNFNQGQGGNALDFLIEYMGMDFKAALTELTGVAVVEQQQGQQAAKKVLELPARGSNDRRVIAYLTKTRSLPADVVVQLIRDKLLYQDTRGNCVFVCRDIDGQAYGAIINGTLSDVRYKQNAIGSDISYPWVWPAITNTDMVTVVESPIDAMSLAVLRPGCRQGHIIALGGLHWTGVEGFLGRTTGVRRAVLALDNDEPGQQVAAEWQKELQGRGYKVWNIIPPGAKDWNDLLRASAG